MKMERPSWVVFIMASWRSNKSIDGSTVSSDEIPARVLEVKLNMYKRCFRLEVVGFEDFPKIFPPGFNETSLKNDMNTNILFHIIRIL
eukprot:14489050-Ditylum_brightwellii.AAC.1